MTVEVMIYSRSCRKGGAEAPGRKEKETRGDCSALFRARAWQGLKRAFPSCQGGGRRCRGWWLRTKPCAAREDLSRARECVRRQGDMATPCNSSAKRPRSRADARRRSREFCRFAPLQIPPPRCSIAGCPRFRSAKHQSQTRRPPRPPLLPPPPPPTSAPQAAADPSRPGGATRLATRLRRGSTRTTARRRMRRATAPRSWSLRMRSIPKTRRTIVTTDCQSRTRRTSCWRRTPKWATLLGTGGSYGGGS